MLEEKNGKVMQSSKIFPTPFFLAAAFIMIIFGASWGTMFLWQLRGVENFTSLNLFAINAHGQAQIYGWVGLMIMGIFSSFLPKYFGKDPIDSYWQYLMIGFMLLGVTMNLVSSIGLPSLFYANLGNGAIVISVLIFLANVTPLLFATKSPAHLFLYTAFFSFVLSALYSFWHHGKTFLAVGEKALLAQVATYQAPLRDLQVHGTALFAVFAFLLCIHRNAKSRRLNLSWVLLTCALVGEISLFLAYRVSQNHVIAAFLPLAWILLFVGTLLFVLELKPVGMFFRTALAWLILSELMLMILPFYGYFSHIPFSHAYYGAIRHAATVGFASLSLIGITVHLYYPMGVSQFSGWFSLLNIGCFFRVVLQILTDWHPIGFSYIAMSGMIEMVGVGLWCVEVFKGFALKARRVVS